MGDYMLIRFNPDRLDMNGQLRFAGGTTEVVAQSNLLAGAELYPAQKICYSAPDGVPVPQPRLSAAEQAGESYVRSTVNWVQYRDGDGGRGFSYPAYCGVKNGKTRDLYFTIDAPAYTLTNGWLTLTALPPLTGTIPAGARVSLSLAGFADGPAAHTDFVVTDGMFEGQTPVLLQENVLDGGVWAGKSLLSRAVAQRNLIRALNARVLASSDVWAEDRGGKLAVFRLAVEAAGGTEDWGFSVGSAATPGVASFFEAVEYRKMLVVRLPNSDFESGLSNWSQTPADATANQISVVADPLDAANHCLRFKSVDTPKGLLTVSQWMYDDALVRKLRSRRMRQSCRAYFPKKLERRSDRLTLYGHFYLVTKNENKSNMNVMSMRWADDYRSAGVWQTVTEEKVFPADQTTGFSFDIRFNCHEPCDVNLGDEAYIDDLELVCEDFWEYPAEKPGLYLFVL
jgi:hypothetical protein